MSIRELAIRNLVAESYSQDELREFCHKHFDAVLCEFGQGASIKEMAMTLVEYCARRERLDFLLDRLKEDRPEKYEKYQKELELPAEVFAPLRRVVEPGLSQTEQNVPPDIYSLYEVGMQQLLSRLGTGHSRYGEALVYHQRLHENISHARRYGETPDGQSDRAAIVEQLNRLALACLGAPFNALCGLV